MYRVVSKVNHLLDLGHGRGTLHGKGDPHGHDQKEVAEIDSVIVGYQEAGWLDVFPVVKEGEKPRATPPPAPPKKREEPPPAPPAPTPESEPPTTTQEDTATDVGGEPENELLTGMGITETPSTPASPDPGAGGHKGHKGKHRR